MSRLDRSATRSGVEAFYPINWTEISLFFATPDAVSSRLTEKTISVHLWSTSILKSPDGQIWRNAPPPANSWLGAMCERYGVGAEIRLDARHRIGALDNVQEGRQSADALTKRGASRPTSQSSEADAQA
jgi:Alpha 1,4-glycosyltransferase conserved region